MPNEFAATGARVKALRGKLSQAEFAERLGVDRKSVAGWEAGKRLPDGTSLLRLALEFGADLNHLLLGQVEVRRLSALEETMLRLFRDATPEVQRSSIGALVGAAQPMVTMTNTAAGGVQVGVVHGTVSRKK